MPALCRELNLISLGLFVLSLVPAFYGLLALVQSRSHSCVLSRA